MLSRGPVRVGRRAGFWIAAATLAAMTPGSVRSALAGRGFLLLPVAALAVHELRYRLAYGPRPSRRSSGRVTATSTRSRPGSCCCSGSRSAPSSCASRARSAAAASARPRRSFAALWLLATASLVAIYAVQELLEGVFAAGPSRRASRASTARAAGGRSPPRSLLGAVVAGLLRLALRGRRRRPRGSRPPAPRVHGTRPAPAAALGRARAARRARHRGGGPRSSAGVAVQGAASGALRPATSRKELFRCVSSQALPSLWVPPRSPFRARRSRTAAAPRSRSTTASELDPASTSLPGVHVRVLDGDRALEARVDEGVRAARARAPARAADPDRRRGRLGRTRSRPPRRTTGSWTEPGSGWVRVHEGRSLAWHDHRLAPPPAERPGPAGRFVDPGRGRRRGGRDRRDVRPRRAACAMAVAARGARRRRAIWAAARRRPWRTALTVGLGVAARARGARGGDDVRGPRRADGRGRVAPARVGDRRRGRARRAARLPARQPPRARGGHRRRDRRRGEHQLAAGVLARRRRLGAAGDRGAARVRGRAPVRGRGGGAELPARARARSPCGGGGDPARRGAGDAGGAIRRSCRSRSGRGPRFRPARSHATAARSGRSTAARPARRSACTSSCSRSGWSSSCRRGSASPAAAASTRRGRWRRPGVVEVERARSSRSATSSASGAAGSGRGRCSRSRSDKPVRAYVAGKRFSGPRGGRAAHAGRRRSWSRSAPYMPPHATYLFPGERRTEMIRRLAPLAAVSRSCSPAAAAARPSRTSRRSARRARSSSPTSSRRRPIQPGKPTDVSFVIRQPDGQPLTRLSDGRGAAHRRAPDVRPRRPRRRSSTSHPPVAADGTIDEKVTSRSPAATGSSSTPTRRPPAR